MRPKEPFFHKLLRYFYGIAQLDERREQELNRINSQVLLFTWCYTILANLLFLVILAKNPKAAAWSMISSNLLHFGLAIPLYTSRRAKRLQLLLEELDPAEARRQKKRSQVRLLLGLTLWVLVILILFPLAVWWAIGGDFLAILTNPINLLVWLVTGLGFGLAVWHVVRRRIRPIDCPAAKGQQQDKGSLSTVVGDEKLDTRENDRCSLFLYVQSNENLGFEILEVAKSKCLPLNVFDEFVCGFQLGIGMRQCHGVGNVGLVSEEGSQNF